MNGYKSTPISLDETDQFLESPKLPKLMESWKSLHLFRKFILPTKKPAGSDDFSGEFHQTFMEEIMSILHNLLEYRKGGNTSELSL